MITTNEAQRCTRFSDALLCKVRTKYCWNTVIKHKQQFTNHEMFLQTLTNLNMMFNKNDDNLKQNISKNIYQLSFEK